MQMRATRSTRRANFADYLPLADMLTLFDQQLGTMQKSAVQAHSMVDHQQMPLQRKGIFCCQHDDTIGRCDKWRAGRHRDIEAAMIAAGAAIVDSLRSETPRYPAP